MWLALNKLKSLHAGLPNSLSSSDCFLYILIYAFHNPRRPLSQVVEVQELSSGRPAALPETEYQEAK